MQITLVIPEITAQVELIREDVMKVVSLITRAGELNEATSAAILHLLDRVHALEEKVALNQQ